MFDCTVLHVHNDLIIIQKLIIMHTHTHIHTHTEREVLFTKSVACMRVKVNITLTVRSSVYLVLHKPLLIYVGRVAQVILNVYAITPQV